MERDNLAVPSFNTEFTLQCELPFFSFFHALRTPRLALPQASSIAMPDDRARCGRRQRGPRWSAERRPGSSQEPARHGTPTTLKRTWVPEARRAGRPIARLA